MEKLKKQIGESFFNPVLYFLPLLIFLVAKHFFDVNLAVVVAAPVALALLVYVYYKYNGLFKWYFASTFLFFLIITLVWALRLLSLPVFIQGAVPELVMLCFLAVYLLFKGIIQAQLLKVVSKLIPMSNNFSELNLVVFRLILLFSFKIIGLIVLFNYNLADSFSQQLFHYLYIALLFFLVVYEFVRVQIIRSKLLAEEWWPIVTEQGKIIGSIHNLTSLNDDRKYMHPVARVHIIDKSMILLQKRAADNVVFPGMWDTAISNHVQMGETIEQCIERTAKDRYSLCNFKYMYLSNYTLEVESEFHYGFLFVSCQQVDYKLNADFADQLKWWTQQQIEAELSNGIFTQNFIEEYDLLKRSGLLETGECECTCRLKDVIYQQSSTLKKE